MDFMYEQSSILIASILLVTMVLALEIGYRLARAGAHSTDATRTHVNAIQASLLGVLALLLGFAFSLALQRFDSRSEAVVAEANAIGTVALRAQLLPASVRSEVRALLQDYVGNRIEAGRLAAIKGAERATLAREAAAMQSRLWRYAEQALAEDDRPATIGLFIQSLNELIDEFGRRQAVVGRHVPELVLFLLYGTFLLTGAIVGYAAGLAGHRASLPTYLMILLIVLLVFIIIDLDRPRRGLIEVKQDSLLELQSTLQAATAAPPTR